jgi:hypothetical protein
MLTTPMIKFFVKFFILQTEIAMRAIYAALFKCKTKHNHFLLLPLPNANKIFCRRVFARETQHLAFSSSVKRKGLSILKRMYKRVACIVGEKSLVTKA